jgi:integrase
MATYTKRGDGWRVQVRRKGVSVSETFAKKIDAVAWATAKEHEINLGTLRAGSDRTVADAMREYEKRVSPTKRAHRWEAIRFKAFIRDFPELAEKKLHETNARDWGEWRDERLKTVGNATVLRDINLYSHVFTIARDEWKWIVESPFKGMRRPNEPQPRKRRYSDEEIKLLLEQLGYRADEPPVTKSARIGATLLFALETAMRAGEILSLTWDAVDTKKRYAHLPRTKNDDARDVPLSPRALAIIKQLEPMKKDFGGKIFGVNSETHSALFRKAKIAALLPDLNFHDSRREALTRLSKIFNVMELAKISGHRDLRILQSVYYAPHVTDLADKLHQVST